MLRPRLIIPRAPRLCLVRPSRSYHTIPELQYVWKEDDKSPQLLTRFGFDQAWTQYQSFILNKLNRLTTAEPGQKNKWEGKDLKTVLLGTARDPESAAIFNHASMAHNNHFFFKHLANSTVKIPNSLRTDLETSFGSIETLRQQMVYTAAAMFGPGFVWLVKHQKNGGFLSYKVLTTYLAGSPYAGAHWRRQDVDLNTSVGSTERGIDTGRKYLENAAYGSGGKEPADNRMKLAPGGIDVVPVLCINTWEHVYLPDYGIAGKLQYAEKWWDFVNWELVAEEARVLKT
ncbi:putative 37S ribosomal protein [Immersiella caudata]|uniref:37S ribosomal protein n=1 Tax=Immersiella caudata TaxID=314043 RepID=A0AA39XEA4_9PEZI|nr:putative 37S ribosomal protein [Immersiella caudata]